MNDDVTPPPLHTDAVVAAADNDAVARSEHSDAGDVDEEQPFPPTTDIGTASSSREMPPQSAPTLATGMEVEQVVDAVGPSIPTGMATDLGTAESQLGSDGATNEPRRIDNGAGASTRGSITIGPEKIEENTGRPPVVDELSLLNPPGSFNAAGLEEIGDTVGPSAAANAEIEEIEGSKEEETTRRSTELEQIEENAGPSPVADELSLLNPPGSFNAAGLEEIDDTVGPSTAATAKINVDKEGRKPPPKMSAASASISDEEHKLTKARPSGIEVIDADNQGIGFDHLAFQSDSLQDKMRKVAPRTSAQAIVTEDVDAVMIVPTNDGDEESPQPSRVLQNETNINHSDNVQEGLQNEEMTRDTSTLHIPNAYLVVETEDSSRAEDPIIDAYATPLLPWWQQRRTRLMMLAVFVILLAAAVAVGVTVSQPPSMTPVVTQVVIESSSPPSLSAVPSSSAVPSMSPTSCMDQVFVQTGHALDLPEVEYDPASGMMIRVDGMNAVVAGREADSENVHLAFYSLTDADDSGGGDGIPRWTLMNHFIEEYGEWNADELYDFHIALVGKTALVGFPLKETDGLVYVYEQEGVSGKDSSSFRPPHWTKADVPIVPTGERGTAEGEGAYFGHRLDRYDDELAVVGAFNENTMYVFKKNALGEWSQRAVLALDHKPYAFWFVARDTILAIDIDNAMVWIYKFDEDSSTIATLQDPIVVRPETIANTEEIVNKMLYFTDPSSSFEDFQAFYQDLFENTDFGYMITNIAVSPRGDYFAFTTSRTFFGQAGWDELGVSVYARQLGGQNEDFGLVQYLNSSDYDVGFGWELDVDDDLMAVSGLNHSYIFTRQNGIFEETSMLDQAYDQIQLSGRNLLLSNYFSRLISSEELKNGVLALDLEMCTQAMPTLMPSSSIFPTEKHSVIPSSSPTSTLNPSSTMRPSYFPSNSLAPSICYDVTVTVVTGAETEGVIAWEVYEKQSGQVVLNGGPTERDQTYEDIIPCLQSSDYVFNITETSIDRFASGFGECTYCGYTIVVDGVTVGGNTYFWYNEVVTFPVPFSESKVGTNQRFDPCHGDFYFALSTDATPQRTSWVLSNVEGETILSGGGYQQPRVTYTEWSCLPDGQYNFTIFDSIGDGSAVGNYILGVDYETLVRSDLNFGSSNWTTFVTGPQLDT